MGPLVVILAATGVCAAAWAAYFVATVLRGYAEAGRERDRHE